MAAPKSLTEMTLDGADVEVNAKLSSGALPSGRLLATWGGNFKETEWESNMKSLNHEPEH